MNNPRLTPQSLDPQVVHPQKQAASPLMVNTTRKILTVACNSTSSSMDRFKPNSQHTTVNIYHTVINIHNRPLHNSLILKHLCVGALYQPAVIPLPRRMLTTYASLLRRAVP